MEERHAFLSDQLEDLRKTRTDLLDIDEVDARVQQVFAEAFADVSTGSTRPSRDCSRAGRDDRSSPTPPTCSTPASRSRPARRQEGQAALPALRRRALAGGGRVPGRAVQGSALALYILDEVEAALDDTNLGRLLEIYEELRENSQLLVITHQKRTMEVGDALYGVTMRGDGVSAVISQRLREAESARIPCPSTTDQDDYVYWEQQTTRWADIDVYGHMNNARYFELIDTVVNNHLVHATGNDIRNLPPSASSPRWAPVLRRDRLPRPVDLGVVVDKVGTSSVVYGVGLFQGEGDEAAAEGGSSTCTSTTPTPPAP